MLSCLTLCGPMDYNPPGSSAHGILQARRLEWVAISSSRGCSWSRDWNCISYISCISRQILYHCTTWKAYRISVPISMYSWPLDNMGLNCTGSLTHGIFFNSKSCSITPSACNWLNPWKQNYRYRGPTIKWYLDFQLFGGLTSIIPLFFTGQLYK